MSKYHELLAAVAKQDWTTAEGIADGLRGGLKLEGYGTKFQVWRGGVPLDEPEVRQAIMDAISTPSVMAKYQQALREMMDERTLAGYEVYVEADPVEGLIFEHGDFKWPVRLDGLEVVVGAKNVEKRRKRRTKKEVEKGEELLKLKRKLDETKNTDKDYYMLHAEQAGYLVRNTAFRFNAGAEGQFGASTMTSITGITLPELRGFVDSAGRESLAGVSTHADASLEKLDDGKELKVITAMHSDFAKEIVDFLNLEFEVDIDAIKAKYREAKDNSGFRPIEYWGADRGTVLNKLIDRRTDLDREEIEKQFKLGYGSRNYGGA